MARGTSPDFSLLASRTWDIFSRDIRDGHTKVMLVQRHQDSCLAREGHIVTLLEAWKRNREAYRWETETQGPFPLPTCIMGFLSIFKRSQASSNFEAFISA